VTLERRRIRGRAMLRLVAWSLTASSAIVLHACDRPVVPVPALRTISAYSASPFAVDLGFDRPLDLASASLASNYVLLRPTGERVTPVRAVWVDTLFGETVRLLFRVGTLDDSTRYRVTVIGVRDAWGRRLFEADSATVDLYTGLWHSYPIRELLERKCTPCHNGQRAGGNYRTDSYAALYDPGSDAGSNPRPNLVPGDARCLLVIRTSPLHSMFNVAHLSYAESQLITNWVVTYQARK
jgi:hypothetical protein